MKIKTSNMTSKFPTSLVLEQAQTDFEVFGSEGLTVN